MTRDDRGRVLLVRQRGGPFKGEWLLPGGGLESGESFEDAMRREVLEETGLEVLAAHSVARYDVRKDDFHGEVTLFAGRVSEGEPRIGVDGEACAWTTVNESAHAVLLRELVDADAFAMPAAAIADRLERAGVRMTLL